MREDVDVTSGDRTGIDIELAKPASLSGRCVDERGMPAAGVVVYAYGDNASAQAVTGEDGNFKLEGLAPGLLYLNCYSENYQSQDDRTFEIRAGVANTMTQDLCVRTRTTASFSLSMLGDEKADWIEGMLEVRDADGNVVSSYYFDCEKSDAGYSVKAVLDGLEPGNWEVKIYVAGDKYWKAESRISISENTPNDLGTFYLDETEDYPPGRIEPCVEERCG